MSVRGFSSCTNLLSRNAHGYATRAILNGNLQQKCCTARTATPVLCEPAHSKCTWAFHKSHFVRKFTGKMPDATDTMLLKQRALTLTVRTSQCGHTVWGKKIGKIKQKLGNKKMLRKRKYPGKSERKTCKIMPESWCNIFFLLLNTPGLFAAYGAKDIALLRTDGLKLSIQHPLHALGTKKMSVDACDTWGCLVPAQIVRERFRPMSKFPSWGMKAKPQKTHRLPPFPQQKLCRILAQKARCCLCKPQESHD